MLDDLPNKAGVVTRMISAENPDGAKGGACKAVPDPADPDLRWSKNAHAEGWKVRPFIHVDAQKTVVLADIAGPGCIRQIFITSDRVRLSELVLRIYWDGEETPSVECPVGAFFCVGHDAYPHEVNSLPISVAPYKGLNCYFSMPFRKHAKITIENQGDTTAEILAYKVLYHLQNVVPAAAYFHAQYRRSLTREEQPEHVILDGIKGKGVFVGTYLAWTSLNSGWWGEGEVKFYLDGDKKYPTIADNGTEDYFGGAWNFGGYDVIGPNHPHITPEQTYSYPYIGMPFARTQSAEGPKKFSLYRFHIEDCIGFEKDIRATVQTIGWQADHKKYKHMSEDVASIAYWYQNEPHAVFPALIPKEKRWDR